MSEQDNELDQYLRLAGLTVPKAWEAALAEAHSELQRMLGVLRGWSPRTGQMPADIFRVLPPGKRDA